MSKYSFLEPLQVGPVTLKNRIVLGAMAKYLCDDNGFITDEYCAHYANIAKGGCALITPGIMAVDPTWPYRSQKQPWLSDDKFIPGIKKFADAVHRAGSKVVCQLWHPGLSGTITKDNPKGCSLNDFSLDQIQSIQEQYFQAARRCLEAGADGVDFHMAHTYLPSQFLSPYFNKRTDQYGSDSLENATRFAVECITRLRKEFGRDFLLTSKINGSDFVEGGITPERAALAAQIVEKAGVDMITVNGGGALTKIIGMSDDGRQPEGWKVPFAETVKRAVKMPVAATGSLRHPEYVDQIIREGKCDLVSLARGLFAEPDWVNKVVQGRENELRHCISCMFCFSAVPTGQAGCSVNPYAKREKFIKPFDKIGAGRTVVVAGAGPSGLEVAVTLAERGFAPVVYEKEDQIGGLVALAKLPPDKTKLGWMIEYYEKQLQRLNIPLHLNSAVTPELLAELKPYALIVATGSNEFVPPIAGLRKENGELSDNVASVRDILRNHKGLTDKNIVILGGGLTGLETARLLHHQGNRVTVLEMLPENPLANMETKLALGDALEDGIAVKMEHRVQLVAPGKVTAHDIQADADVEFPADLVILSLGIRPDKSIPDGYENQAERVYRVGDAGKLGKISTAVESGNTVGFGVR